MPDPDAFERILASLYDAMLDDTLWPATSALIDDACGMQGNALMIRAGPPDDGRVTFVGFYYRGERRADWERAYMERYHPINEAVPRFRQLPDSRVVPTAALYTAQELRTSPTYNEAFLRGHSQDGLNIRLDGPDGSHIAWFPFDPVAPGGWGAPQLAPDHRAVAAYPPICSGPAGAGPSRGAGGVPDRPARHPADRGHLPGPAGADHRGE